LVWWTLTTAFGFMFLIVLSANLLADAIRDAFDPRTRLRSAHTTAAPTQEVAA
jgi:peptide/nickel transport system permease protein